MKKHNILVSKKDSFGVKELEVLSNELAKEIVQDEISYKLMSYKTISYKSFIRYLCVYKRVYESSTI